MRILYTCLFYLSVPAILLRLAWRGIKAPEYWRRWHERFAFYRQAFPSQVIWFHAVSVGEAESLFPLVRRIQSRYPEIPLLITTTTPTGSARVKAVLKDSVSHVYLPYDLPDVLNRFMRCFKPKLAVIMETEIWPNLYACCSNHKTPLFLINARLSERSVRGYQRIPTLIRPALAQITWIAAQTPEDCQRFAAIGATANITAVGNIKFDVEIPEDAQQQGLKLKADLFPKRFVWLIASTHTGEEAILLTVFQQLKAQIPELLLVIAPRHPERFEEVRQLCSTQHLNTITRSSNLSCSPETDVFVLDSLGELKQFYGAADVAFVGGSLVAIGGHNVLEAAAVGVPVLFGPYMANFKAIAKSILEQEAAIQCATPEAIREAIIGLYADPESRAQLISKGHAFIKNNQGATEQVFKALIPFLNNTAY